MARKSLFHHCGKLLGFTCLIVAGVVLLKPASSCADSGKGCAVDTWIAMVNQAALESRREDLLNKRFIVKSSSVLQYSCFASEIGNMAAEIAPIFSGNEDEWMDRTVLASAIEGAENIDISPMDVVGINAETLGKALEDGVQKPLEDYIGANFNHLVLSGTTAHTEADPLCFNMGAIWQAAKCKNFDDTKVFYTFEELVNFDPREFPPNMPCEL